MPTLCRNLVLCLLLCMASVGHVFPSTLDDLMRMTEKLDKMDKADFDELVGKARGCIRGRDFDCAEDRLAQAGRLANGSRDRQMLADTRRRLDDERETVRREEAERIATAERQRRAKEEQARINECNASCAHGGQRMHCIWGKIEPRQCNRSDDDDRPSFNAGLAALQGINNSLAGYSQIQRIHNQGMANIQAQQAQRIALEQMQRDQQRIRQREENERAREAQAERARAQQAQAQRERAEQMQREQQAREQRQQEERTTQAAQAERRAAEQQAQTQLASAQRPGGGSELATSHPAPRTETRTVVVEGSTEACFSREMALKLAYVSAENAGNKGCRELGASWRWKGINFKGYEQCKQCGTSNEYRCFVTQAVHACTGQP